MYFSLWKIDPQKRTLGIVDYPKSLKKQLLYSLKNLKKVFSLKSTIEPSFSWAAQLLIGVGGFTLPINF